MSVIASLVATNNMYDDKDVKSSDCDSKANKCDMSECSKMSKKECAAMCAAKGCSEEETAECLSHYDEAGNWEGTEEE